MTTLPDLTAIVHEIPAEDLPWAIAVLEGAKAAAWARLGTSIKRAQESATEEDVRCMDVPKAAALLDLHESQVYEMIRQGRLPSVRVGKYVRVPLPALKTWLEGGFGTALISRSRRRGGKHSDPARPDVGRLSEGGGGRTGTVNRETQ
jgi:excisionase family DNA binding protein